MSLIRRHGWQGTEEGKRTGDVAVNRKRNPGIVHKIVT